MVLPTVDLGTFLWLGLEGGRGGKVAEGNSSMNIIGWDIAPVLWVVVIDRTPKAIT